MKNVEFISKRVLKGEYFFLDLTPEKDAVGTVVCGGFERCASNYRVARNHFNFHSIEYVVGGQGKLTLHNRTFDLRPGALFGYTPTTPHIIVSDRRKPLVKYFVDFCGPRFTTLLEHHPIATHEPVYVVSALVVRQLFDALQEQGRNNRPQAAAICACLLELLILQTHDTALPQADADSPAHATFQRVQDAIGQHFMRFTTQTDIAAFCHIDTAYLCRLFKRYGTESPYDMLLRLKMRQAADLLNGPTSLIKEVAGKVGFSDPYHFSRVFKKIYGCAPKAFVQSGHRLQRTHQEIFGHVQDPPG